MRYYDTAMSIAALAATAFDAIAGHFPGAVKDCLLRHPTGQEYDPVTGQYVVIYDETEGRCCFDTTRPVEDSLPSLIPGPQDLLVHLEGLAFAPVEGDSLVVDGVTYSVQQGADVAMTGGAFAAVVRRA